MPLRIAKDETPTRPHVDAEDGLVRGDYAILKLALERAEAECARLSAALAGQTAYSDEVRNQRDYYADLVEDARQLLISAGILYPDLGYPQFWAGVEAWLAKPAAWAREAQSGEGEGDSNERR